MGGIEIFESDVMLEGHQILWRKGSVIWAGPLNAPTEDIDFDEIWLHPCDAAILKTQTRPV